VNYGISGKKKTPSQYVHLYTLYVEISTFVVAVQSR
jgi:hypothetical protein